MATLQSAATATIARAGTLLVRIAGYPAIGKSFRTQLEAKLRAARTEAAAKRRAHWHPLGG